MKRLAAILVLIVCCAAAQAQQWTGSVRGSWVRTDAAKPGDVTLAGRGPGCEIAVAGSEAPAVKQAARFLAGDIEKISGFRPQIVSKASGKRVAIHLLTCGDGVTPAAVQTDKLNGLWEAHRIVTASRDVWLVGSDFRGTAFAAYTLSERLGIDPLYIWTGYRPAHHDVLILKKTDYYAPPPTFRFRGMFHDDEDVLPRPLINGIPDKNGTVPTEWYARFFETALRLRMNMVAPFVRVQRPYAVRKMASDWGLFYTSHHYDALLSNPYGYDRFGLARQRGVTGPYDWATNKDGLLKFWKGGVTENKDLHCIWPVGLRGTEDYGMPFPAGTTEAQKAQAFGEAISDQVAMTKAVLPTGEEALFHFTLYSEMLGIYQSGLLDVPSDVILVWTDNNDGVMLGLPEQLGKWHHGVYYHLAYLGPNVSKQTFPTVQPTRIEQEFRKIVAAGATGYLLVNVSELREFVMGMRMIAEIGWDAKTAFARPDAAGRYMDWWSREYFGPQAAPAASKAYQDYYRLIAQSSDLYIGTNKVLGAVGSLQAKFDGRPFAPARPETLPNLQQRAAQYRAAMQDIAAAKAKMTLSEKRFFDDNVTLGLLSDACPTQAAVLLVQAMSEPDHVKSDALCRQAMEPLALLEKELASAERPPFEGWFGPTWILTPDSTLNPHRAHRALQSLLDALAKEVTAP